ncbi:MAG: glycosyltransferase family 2 protein, partial [Candidatus Xenobia bacterium]
MVIIIPAKNEAATLPQVLQAVRRVSPADVLLIDDGSSDRTCAAACGVEGVHVLRHARSLGYGRALLDGFNWAAEHGHETAVTLDADLQHEAADLPAFMAAIETCDIASGTR